MPADLLPEDRICVYLVVDIAPAIGPIGTYHHCGKRASYENESGQSYCQGHASSVRIAKMGKLTKIPWVEQELPISTDPPDPDSEQEKAADRAATGADPTLAAPYLQAFHEEFLQGCSHKDLQYVARLAQAEQDRVLLHQLVEETARLVQYGALPSAFEAALCKFAERARALDPPQEQP